MNLTCVTITRNQDANILGRTINSLRSQTLPTEEWELIIVDNNDEPQIQKSIDISWHKNTKVIHEPRPGAVHARYTGIKHAVGEIITQVDDDNVLDVNYFQNSLSISKKYKHLGSWGAGKIIPEFEIEPPEWYVPYLRYLAIIDINEVRWTNVSSIPYFLDTFPNGAGMSLRNEVAKLWKHKYENDPIRREFLGRKKGIHQNGFGEDIDMTLAALDINLGFGVFPELSLIHIINKNRLTEQYLSNLLRGNAYGAVISNAITSGDNHGIKPTKQTFKSRLFAKMGIFGNEIQTFKEMVLPAIINALNTRNRKLYREQKLGDMEARIDIQKFLDQLKRQQV